MYTHFMMPGLGILHKKRYADDIRISYAMSWAENARDVAKGRKARSRLDRHLRRLNCVYNDWLSNDDPDWG